jgi:hypothetical protein
MGSKAGEKKYHQENIKSMTCRAALSAVAEGSVMLIHLSGEPGWLASGFGQPRRSDRGRPLTAAGYPVIIFGSP